MGGSFLLGAGTFFAGFCGALGPVQALLSHARNLRLHLLRYESQKIR